MPDHFLHMMDRPALFEPPTPGFVPEVQASNGQYLTAEYGGGSAVDANRDSIGPWEAFYLYYLQ